MHIYTIGRWLGLTIMIISFITLVFLAATQAQYIFLWEIGTAFWFGSSIFWESSCYEKIID